MTYSSIEETQIWHIYLSLMYSGSCFVEVSRRLLSASYYVKIVQFNVMYDILSGSNTRLETRMW